MASKITQLHVYLVGGVLMVLIGFGLFFLMIKPLQDANVILKGEVSTAESTQVSIDNQNFTWNQVEEGKKALAAAKERRKGKEAKLASLTASKRLPRNQEIDLRDGTDEAILRSTMSRWLQLPRIVVDMMEDYARARGRRRGVTVTTAFAAPAPSTAPSSIPRDIIAWNLGGMTMRGRFERVMAWARDWNNSPLISSVDGLKCSVADRDGVVSATATLTVYIFPTGKAVTTPGAGGGGAPAEGGGMMMPGGAAGTGGDSGMMSNGP